MIKKEPSTVENIRANSYWNMGRVTDIYYFD